jgi:hypothetical protein
VEQGDIGLAKGQGAPGDAQGKCLDDDPAAAEFTFHDHRIPALCLDEGGHVTAGAGVEGVASKHSGAIEVEPLEIGEQDGGGMGVGGGADRGELIAIRRIAHRRRQSEGREAGSALVKKLRKPFGLRARSERDPESASVLDKAFEFLEASGGYGTEVREHDGSEGREIGRGEGVRAQHRWIKD